MSETFWYAVLAVGAALIAIATYIEQIMDTLGAALLFFCAPALIVVLVCFIVGWIIDYRRSQEKHNAEVERLRVETAALAARAQAETTALTVASSKDSQFTLMAGDIPLPISALQNPEIVQALLQLAAQRIDSQKTHAPVPNTIHITNRDEKEQSLTVTGQQFDANRLLNDSQTSEVMALLTEE